MTHKISNKYNLNNIAFMTESKDEVSFYTRPDKTINEGDEIEFETTYGGELVKVKYRLTQKVYQRKGAMSNTINHKFKVDRVV